MKLTKKIARVRAAFPMENATGNKKRGQGSTYETKDLDKMGVKHQPDQGLTYLKFGLK